MKEQKNFLIIFINGKRILLILFSINYFQIIDLLLLENEMGFFLLLFLKSIFDSERQLFKNMSSKFNIFFFI